MKKNKSHHSVRTEELGKSNCEQGLNQESFCSLHREEIKLGHRPMAATTLENKWTLSKQKKACVYPTVQTQLSPS